MRLISHRGNINGKQPHLENEPKYVNDALKKGYDVEIDLWFVDGFFWLGHDKPQYEIALNWLTRRSNHLWVHCKDIKTIEELKHLEETLGYKELNYFYHQTDDVTITSKGYIWAFPGKQPLKYSIAVQPERYDDDVSKCYGVCSDFISKFTDEIFTKRNQTII